MKDHNYDSLVEHRVSTHIGTACPVKGDSSRYNLTFRECNFTKVREIPGLTRMETLIYLAMLCTLPFLASLEDVLDRAAAMCKDLDHNTHYKGCRFNIFFHLNGEWGLEFEPGMGTTVSRMTFTTQGDALQALMGILVMLSTQRGDRVPYLQRNPEHSR